MPDSYCLEETTCNLCGNVASVGLLDKAGLPVARCPRCGLIYANPRLPLSEIWKRYSPDYFWREYMPAHCAANGEYLGEWHRPRAMPILSRLAPYRSTNRLLEVGCAAGFWLKVAEEQGWCPQGIEIMEPAVEYARTRLGLEVFQGTLQQAAFPAGTFDAVILEETIEHVLDPLGLLQEIYRILRPGGAVWIGTPNFNSIMRTLLGTSWSVVSPAEHLFYFTAVSLSAMCRRAGFCSVKVFAGGVSSGRYPEVINPFNSHAPNSLRSRLVRSGILACGPLLAPLAIRCGRSDHLSVLSEK